VCTWPNAVVVVRNSVTTDTVICQDVSVICQQTLNTQYLELALFKSPNSQVSSHSYRFSVTV